MGEQGSPVAERMVRYLMRDSVHEETPPVFHCEAYADKTYTEIREEVRRETRWTPGGLSHLKWIKDNQHLPITDQFKIPGMYFHFFADTPDEINGWVLTLEIPTGKLIKFKDWGDEGWSPTTNRVVFVS